MVEGTPQGVLDLIKSRRSVARMKPDPVSRDVIAQCLEAAVWVPNHRLTEPWRFFVLQGEAKRRLAELRRDFRRSTMPNPDAPEAQPALERLYNDTLQTPAVIVVTSALAADPETLEEDLWATFAAAYALMLGLWSFGVGSYWRTGPLRDFPPLRQLLDLPADRRVTGLLYVGYPAELPQKRRTAAADKTVWLD
jgi:nitroreductase